MSDKFFLDTNILVYAHDSEDLDKQRRSQELVEKALRTGDGLISPQVLSEYYVTVTKKIQTPLSEDVAKREINVLSDLCRIDLDATLVRKALDLKARWKLSYWDALILSAAERGSCTILYSEDLSHGQKIENILVQNPFKT